MKDKKKVILLYPYYCGISGAYNRYLLLEKLFKKTNTKAKFILIKYQKFKFFLVNFIYKFLKFLKIKDFIFFYSVIKNFYFITDFNPSITALFSKNVFVQIHDVSWVNKNFVSDLFFIQYLVLLVLCKYTNC